MAMIPRLGAGFFLRSTRAPHARRHRIMLGHRGARNPRLDRPRGAPALQEGKRAMEALQLYAIWALASVGAAGAGLAWWLMY
jgi:hypothetical protein